LASKDTNLYITPLSEAPSHQFLVPIDLIETSNGRMFSPARGKFDSTRRRRGLT
jgi:hypothetical protein